MSKIKLIKRDYLDKVIEVIGTPDIKVITGVRRCGKSKLLKLFEEYIIKNIKNYNIIYIDLSEMKNKKLRQADNLYEYVSNNYIPNKENFIMIDEVQRCLGFEDVINSFHAEEKYDIYLTGSNAFLSSSDLATLFTGRTYEIEVYPFSYLEFLKYYELEVNDSSFDEYVEQGGLSGSYLYKSRESRLNYVSEVYNTLIIRDIKSKYKIKNVVALDKLNDFLMDNISNLSSGRNIASTLSKNGNKVDDKTVNKYMGYLCNAFLYYKVRRYDIQGKKYLSFEDKYYLVDQTFKYAKIGTKNMNYGRIYENIVAIELLRRGYEVYAGVLYNKEIDFVAIKRDEKIYIQVSDNISEDTTFNREVSSLLQIKDAYPKILIARTHHDTYQYEGIQIVDLPKWLSDNI